MDVIEEHTEAKAMQERTGIDAHAAIGKMRKSDEVKSAEQEMSNRRWLCVQNAYNFPEARQAAERLSARGLRPATSEYERGLWDGQCAALRWVLGHEWENFDT